jgi:ERF superfamily
MTETKKVPGSLAEALAMLQADLPHVAKGQDARIEKDGRVIYSYKYADLTDVTDAIMPRMAKLGLSFTCCPTLDEQGRFLLDYSLQFAGTQEAVIGGYPLPNGGSPQEIGKAITYARRYALCAVTGLAPGGDDDDAGEAERGHHARAKRVSDGWKDYGSMAGSYADDEPPARPSKQTAAQQRAARTPAPKPGAGRKRAIEHEKIAASTRDTGGVMEPGPIPDAENLWQGPPPDGENAPGSISAGQHRAIEMLLTKWGIAREARADRHLAVVEMLRGTPYELELLDSLSELTFVQAQVVISRIQDEMIKERTGV